MTNYWKHPQFGHVYCGDLATPPGRFVWASLVTPKAAPPPQEGQPPGQPRYELSLLLPKTDPKVKEFIVQLEALVKGGLEVFNKGRSATIGINSIFGKVGDGDTWDAEKYPYYKGHWVLAARNALKPKVLGKAREEIAPETIKGGMIGRLVITPMITAHGASYKLLIAQLINDDGVRYGGGARDVTDLLTELDDVSSAQGPVETAKLPVPEIQMTLPLAPVAAPKPAVGKGKDAAVNLLA